MYPGYIAGEYGTALLRVRLKYVRSVSKFSTEYANNSVDRLLIYRSFEMPSLVPGTSIRHMPHIKSDSRCDYLSEHSQIAAVKLYVVVSKEFALQFG